ncbi:MAG: PadR family transcriptional regulator [Actinomycetales bacterium]|nr:MAG: PadR family transcriptional regulator [Actinomycetales bacterium]
MSSVFAHGQLRLYLLALLADGPRHGYELIQQLESRFAGLYSPSAGTVYPRLAKLEEEGLLERVDEGRKATYRITDAGRSEVDSRRAEIEQLQIELDQSVRRLADDVRASVRDRSADLRAELKAAASAARAQARNTRKTGPVRHERTASSADRGRNANPPGSGHSDLDAVVDELREQASAAWRRHGITSAQALAIGEIITEASTRIAEVLQRPPEQT